MDLQALTGAATATVSRIADEVRAEMARQRKTAADLSQVIGVTQHTAGRRLNGAIPFDVAELYSVSEWLGIGMADLIARATSADRLAS